MRLTALSAIAILALACTTLSIAAPAPPNNPAKSEGASPAGTWLIPTTHEGAPTTVKTSIGVLSMQEQDHDSAKSNAPFTSISLNGKPISFGDDEGLYENGLYVGTVAIERVLDFGGQIDLVYARKACVTDSDCGLIRAVAQLNRAGRVQSSVDAQQDSERRNASPSTDAGAHWTQRDGMHVLVLGRNGHQVKEVQLSMKGVRIALSRSPQPRRMGSVVGGRAKGSDRRVQPAPRQLGLLCFVGICLHRSKPEVEVRQFGPGFEPFGCSEMVPGQRPVLPHEILCSRLPLGLRNKEGHRQEDLCAFGVSGTSFACGWSRIAVGRTPQRKAHPCGRTCHMKRTRARLPRRGWHRAVCQIRASRFLVYAARGGLTNRCARTAIRPSEATSWETCSQPAAFGACRF